MGNVFPFRRLLQGPPRGLPSPYFQRKRRPRFGGLGNYAGFLALALVVAVAAIVSDQWYGWAPYVGGERVANGAGITVIDGDTLRVDGQVYRLIGFDTPETRPQAKCDGEHAMALAATRRLRQLVTAGGLDLERVPCACRPGTEGTRACNFGRLCGVLKARGRDVGAILIAEGLAREYLCGESRCPRRESWCS